MRTLGILVAAAIILSLLAITLLITQQRPQEVVVVTTTSLYATGFLDYIKENFESEYPGIVVKIVSMGSGAALEAAARGDGDVVYAHAPSLEAKYIDMGVLKDHVIIAFNYFVIVGPPDDPANVRDAPNPVEAFRRIYMKGLEGEALFISRGDNSGTHVKELQIWSEAGIEPGGDWYIETGSGMGQTLLIAEEKRGYTLSDIGTYIVFKKEGRITLEKLYDRGFQLLNIYSIYLVDGADEAAEKYFRYVANNAERLVRGFNELNGEVIFYPPREYEGDIVESWMRMAGEE